MPSGLFITVDRSIRLLQRLVYNEKHTLTRLPLCLPLCLAPSLPRSLTPAPSPASSFPNFLPLSLGVNGAPGTGMHPALAAALSPGGGAPMPPSRGQPVANPVVGAAPTVLQHPTLQGITAGPAKNPFTAHQPNSVAFSTNPLSYHPGSMVSHPSAVAAAAVVQTAPMPALVASYMGGNLPYHIDQAMGNGAQRAREYMIRSTSAARPGEGLGYGAGAFPPTHVAGLPPRYGGAVNGFPTRYGMPGAGIAAGVRIHQITPGFTPYVFHLSVSVTCTCSNQLEDRY